MGSLKDESRRECPPIVFYDCVSKVLFMQNMNSLLENIKKAYDLLVGSCNCPDVTAYRFRCRKGLLEEVLYMNCFCNVDRSYLIK